MNTTTTTMTTQNKKNKSYPPPDRSKVYDTVPRTEKPQLSAFSRICSRISTELCFIALEEREKVVAYVLAVLFIAMMIGLPFYMKS